MSEENQKNELTEADDEAVKDKPVSLVTMLKNDALGGCATLVLIIPVAGVGFGIFKLLGLNTDDYENDTVVIVGGAVLVAVVFLVVGTAAVIKKLRTGKSTS
ncbi:MAG: hypothetical protein V3V10_07065 [Planctomycetota bacterium]